MHKIGSFGQNEIILDGYAHRVKVRNFKNKRLLVIILEYGTGKRITCYYCSNTIKIYNLFKTIHNGDFIKVKGKLGQSKISSVISIRNITVLKPNNLYL